MTTTLHPLDELADRLERGEPFSAADVAAVLGATDLVRIGILGDNARRRLAGDTVTFARVATVARGAVPAERGSAGEVRIVGVPQSPAEAVAIVEVAARLAESIPLSGFELSDLSALVGHDHLALADLAAALSRAGMVAVAELAIDRVESADAAAEMVRAARHGGLVVQRLVVAKAAPAERLGLIERADAVAKDCGGIEALAPLPRFDPVEEPATGYDDVKTVALARLLCTAIPRIQVDWPLYGPKLAQVAVAFGANDIDGIAPVDDPALGTRRAPAEDIRRQIRSASATPVERDGLFRTRE
jgi:hypothetical protein